MYIYMCLCACVCVYIYISIFVCVCVICNTYAVTYHILHFVVGSLYSEVAQKTQEAEALCILDTS